MSLNPQDHARVTAAIAQAEARTSGEIYCVHAERVSSHFDVVLAWSAGLALTAPLLLVPLGFSTAWAPGLAGGWTAGHLAAVDQTVAATLAAYGAVQAVIFAAVCGLGLIPSVRRLMVPRMVRRTRCRQVALAQFLAHGVHVTEGRTGVLIFACQADHQVEIIADRGVHERIEPDYWVEVAAVLARRLRTGDVAGGYEQAIRLCGDALATAFPPGAVDRNELADRLVEL